jgi:diaminopimelate decarboxylase
MANDPDTSALEMHLGLLGHEDGKALRIGGLPATELADRFETPLYVYDAQVLRQRYQAVREALGPDVRISFALKANPSLAVSDVLRREGAQAEVASAGEIHAAVAAGFVGKQIQFAGPGKSREDIDHAVRQGVARLNLESPAEYELVARISSERGVRQNVAIRVNPDKAMSGSRMHMGGGTQKFGVDVDQLDELVRRILDEGAVELRGLHVYGGTQCFDAEAWIQNAQALHAIADRLEDEYGIRLMELNFGGGFGVPYFEGDPTFDLRRAGEGLQQLIAADHRKGRAYHVELGRYLVASAGVYLTRVCYLKEPIVACRDVEGREVSYALGGPLCTPADEFAAEAVLPQLSRGDLLAILGSGAYGLTFSSVLFLSHPTPAEVLVDRGTGAIVRERGQLDDVVRGQALPPDLRS